MIYFIDFDDSFNLNIQDHLERIDKVEVIHYLNFNKSIDLFCEGDIICFGPGPGHVDEYIDKLSGIQSVFDNQKIMKFGICLGHQIILKMKYDAILKPCKKAVHGQKVELKNISQYMDTDLSSTLVQRYNSWTIDSNSLKKGEFVLDEHDELALFKDGQDTFTMQFHPESIGTSCPEIFFQPLNTFLRYSNIDGVNKTGRNLR